MSDWSTLLAADPSVAEANAGALGWHKVSVDAPWPDDNLLAAMENAKSPVPQQLADGRWIAGLYQPPTCWILLRDGDTTERWEMPAGWVTKDIHVAPSGTRALVYAQHLGRGVVAELEFATGALEIVDVGIDGTDKTEFANVWDATYVGDDDHLVVMLDNGTDGFAAVYVRTDAGWRETDNEKTKGFSVVSTGQVALVGREKDGFAVAVVGDQVAKLGKVGKQIRRMPTPADTREVLWGCKFGGGDASVLVGAAVAAGGKKAKKPKKGTAPTRRIPNAHIPRWASDDEQAAAFGEGWRADKLAATGRTAAGRLLATPPGRIVIGEAGNAAVEAATDGDWILRAAHPSAERALVVGRDKHLAVLDVEAGTIGAPIAEDVFVADYVALPNGDAAIVIQRQSNRDAVELHLEPLTGSLGEPAVRIPLDGGAKAGVAGGAVVITRPGKKKDTWDIERWPVTTDGDALHCEKDALLVLPGKRYAKLQVMPRTIAGMGVLWTYKKPRFYFEF